MKSDRTYKAGRETTGWRKGERVTRVEQVKVGMMLIMDSHQFKATNLVKVAATSSVGFDYQYANPDRSVILEPMMTHYDVELDSEHKAFYHAEKVK